MDIITVIFAMIIAASDRDFREKVDGVVEKFEAVGDGVAAVELSMELSLG